MFHSSTEWAVRANAEVTRFAETGDCRTPEEIAAANRRAELTQELAPSVGELALQK